jgi:hypothetical protein
MPARTATRLSATVVIRAAARHPSCWKPSPSMLPPHRRRAATQWRLVGQAREPASMFRRALAAIHSDEGETSMRLVEYFLAFTALAAAGILAFIR